MEQTEDLKKDTQVDENDQKTEVNNKARMKSLRKKYTLRRLKKELLHRPEILMLIMYLQKCLLRKKKAIKKIKSMIKLFSNLHLVKSSDASTQTDVPSDLSTDDWKVGGGLSWDSNVEESGPALSLVDQVKEAAETALQQTGMVYEPTSGMYYDYSTGYYYNAELGLYYHSTTGFYYYYDEAEKQFLFHSHADTSQFTTTPAYQTGDGTQPSDKTKRKHKKGKDASVGKVKKSKGGQKVAEQSDSQKEVSVKKSESIVDCEKTQITSDLRNVLDLKKSDKLTAEFKANVVKTKPIDNKEVISEPADEVTVEKVCEDQRSSVVLVPSDLEDGECSGSDDSASESSDTSDSNESVVNQYPPCMRIIIQETSHEKLKVGSLFLLTKDGGTLGREGGSHAVTIPEENVSRHHMTFNYDTEKYAYFAVDMGSRNGTILNGKRMSSAQQESDPMEVVHGSIIQLGSTKLLCHIHKGNSTCGHCEPGLLIKDSEAPQSVIYKPANIKTQHKKELHRLKIKFGVNPFKENDVADGEMVLPEGYEDKAQKRREKVGSLHHGAKTEQTSLDTSIASTNKGFKMLQKMGWAAGEGLGKDAQGNKEPVPIVSNLGKSGLGTAGARSATPMPPPPPQKSKVWLATKLRFDKLSTSPAFNDEDDVDDDILTTDVTKK